MTRVPRTLADVPDRTSRDQAARGLRWGARLHIVTGKGGTGKTTVAPGVRDVLLTGKVKEATTRAEGGRRSAAAAVPR